MTVALFTGAAVAFNAAPAFGYIPFSPPPISDFLPSAQKQEFIDTNCVTKNCPDLSENQLHTREVKALDEFSWFDASFYDRYFGGVKKNQEYLRLNKEDTRDKFLFFSSENDYNGALDPSRITSLASDINKQFDMKYKVVNSYEKICDEIKSASKVGKLSNVLLHSYANENGMLLSDRSLIEGWIHKGSNFTECFNSLDPSGKIVLLGSYLGKPNENGSSDNLAQIIATAAKRMVVAPIDNTYSDKIQAPKMEDFEVLHPPQEGKDGKNIFKAFYPIYENCVKPSTNNIHPREQSLIDVLKQKSLASSYLIQPDNFSNLDSVLSFCKDDPKQKFLFLSADYDHNGGLDPKYNPEIFDQISKNYDVKFKVVKSFNEICKEFEEADKSGDFINVVINIHGNNGGMCIDGEGLDKCFDWIYEGQPISKCFSGLSKSGKITLISCETAKPNADDLKGTKTIAYKIAQSTQRSVVASLEESSIHSIKITSIKPFEIFEPSLENPLENKYTTIKK